MYFFQIGFKNSVEKFSFQDSDQPPGAWLMAVPLLAESCLLHCKMATSASRPKADVSGSGR
jgi:hypothetical protein